MPDDKQALTTAREKVLRESLNLANDICYGGPAATVEALKAVDVWEQGEHSENLAYDNVVKTQDRNEALRAFAEKRKPVFTGR